MVGRAHARPRPAHVRTCGDTPLRRSMAHAADALEIPKRVHNCRGRHCHFSKQTFRNERAVFANRVLTPPRHAVPYYARVSAAFAGSRFTPVCVPPRVVGFVAPPALSAVGHCLGPATAHDRQALRRSRGVAKTVASAVSRARHRMCSVVHGAATS